MPATTSASSSLETITELATLPAPSTWQDYFVRVSRAGQRDIVCPVTKMERAADDFTITASLAGIAFFANTNAPQDFKVSVPAAATQESVQCNYGGTNVTAYTKFSALVNAIKAAPSATHYFTGDLHATAESANAYIPGDFTGSLIGIAAEDGTPATIYDTNKPLFTTMKGTVKDFCLYGVNISAGASVGAVAIGTNQNGSTKALAENVHVWGSLSSSAQSMGGLFGTMEHSQVTSCSFSGTLTATGSCQNTGGLVGAVNSDSNIKTSYAEVDITNSSSSSNHTCGALVGWLVGTALEKNYVKGTINHTGSSSNNVGGLFGGRNNGGRTTSALIDVNVTGGYLIHGTQNAPKPNQSDVNAGMKIYVPRDIPQNLESNDNAGDGYGKTIAVIERTEIPAKLAEMGVKLVNITPKQMGVSTSGLDALFDITKVAGYNEANATAYANAAQFMPLAQSQKIVQVGNIIASDVNLGTRALSSVVPLVAAVERPSKAADYKVADFITATNSLNAVALRYDDGALEVCPVRSGSGTGAYNDPLKFALDNMPSELVYAPSNANPALTSENITKTFIPEAQRTKMATLKAWAKEKTGDNTQDGEGLYTDEYKALLGNANVNNIRDMYLDAPFKRAAQTFDEDIPKLIANSDVANLSNDAIKKYVSAQVERDFAKLTVGLTYFESIYNFSVANQSIKNLLSTHLDVFGKSHQSALAWTSFMGTRGHGTIKMGNNTGSYNNFLAARTGYGNVKAFIEGVKGKLLPEKPTSEWFKETSKAIIVEAESRVATKDNCPRYEIRAFYRLDQQYILPLLSLPMNDMYVGITLPTVVFGSAEGKINYHTAVAYLKDPNSAQGSSWSGQQASFARDVQNCMNNYRDYFDAWYMLIDDKIRRGWASNGHKTWDSYKLDDGTGRKVADLPWASPNFWNYEGASSLSGFFGPVGEHFNNRSTAQLSVSADANGWWTHFHSTHITDKEQNTAGYAGTLTATHEFCHSFLGSDGFAGTNVYFNGYQTRPANLRSETSANGLAQSPNTANANRYSLQFANDFSSAVKNGQSPLLAGGATMTSKEYLENYMHNLWDVTYLLDYAEAEAMLKQPTLNRQRMLCQAKNRFASNGRPFGNYSNQISAETAESLKSIDDFVDQDIASMRSWANNGEGPITYGLAPMTAPNWAGFCNSSTTVGVDGRSWLHASYEMLAAKGWDEGFLGYASNKWQSKASSEGAQYNDLYVLAQIFGGDYKSGSEITGGLYKDYAEFRKAMFHERINKQDKLRGGIKLNDGTTINSFADIQRRMNELIQQYANGMNRVYSDDLRKRYNKVDELRVESIMPFGRNYSADLDARDRLDAFKLDVISKYNQLTNNFQESVFNEPKMGADMSDVTVSEIIQTFTYDGTAKTPVLALTHNHRTLVKDTDYTVQYSNNTNAGTATVMLKGKGDYTGEIKREFTILKAPIDVPRAESRLIYNGKQQVGVPEGEGYTISHNTGTDASTSYSASVTPDSNHRWSSGTPDDTRPVAWSIEPKSLSGAEVSLKQTSFNATGMQFTPEIASVTVDGIAVSPSDYELSCSDTTHPTSATLTLTGTGNFKDSATASFTVRGVLSKVSASATIADVSYSEDLDVLIKPVVKLADGTELVCGRDYRVSYADLPQRDPGAGKSVQVRATFTGIGNYEGDVAPSDVLTCNFAVIGKESSGATVNSYSYTGKPVRPDVVLRNAQGEQLDRGTDYLIAYSNNVRPGTARLTVVGIGLYCGTIESKFKIVPMRSSSTNGVVPMAAVSDGELEPIDLGIVVAAAGDANSAGSANSANNAIMGAGETAASTLSESATAANDSMARAADESAQTTEDTSARSMIDRVAVATIAQMAARGATLIKIA